MYDKIMSSQSFKYLSTNTSVNIAVHPVIHSICHLFSEGKELSPIKSVNEMTGKDVYTFSESSDLSLLKI